MRCYDIVFINSLGVSEHAGLLTAFGYSRKKSPVYCGDIVFSSARAVKARSG